MIKKIIYSSLILLMSSNINLTAQNSEQRTLPAISGVRISGKSKISIHNGETQSVTVQTKGALSEVQTSVENGILKINGPSSKLAITIPVLNSISVDGIGEVMVDSAFKTETFSIKISGNGKIMMPIEADNIITKISGNGKLKISGTAKEIELDISGNGKVDATELHVENAKANISGIGKCLLDVTNNLDVKISGNGSIYYKTEPAHITKQISGVGKLGTINTSDKDTTTVHLGNKRIVIIGDEEAESNQDFDVDIDINADIDDDSHYFSKKRKSRSHWMGLDLGYNNYFNGDFGTSLPKQYDYLELNTGKSVGVNLNFFAHDFKLYRRYVMFTTGLGMSINNFRFNSDRTLIPEIDSVNAFPDTLAYDLSKHKLEIAYVTVPLLLQFNTNEYFKKSFHIATGVLMSYRIESHTKRVYSMDGDKRKDKTHDDFNINPFRAETTLRLGYRGATVFFNYAFTELFKSGTGPELHPFTFGLSLLNW